MTAGKLLLLFLFGALACSRESNGPIDSILLVTIDTCRSDRIGCYGNAAAITPTMDRLAAGGLLFSNCNTQVPSTLPSHATILSSLYPRTHGVPRNGFVLPEDVRTMAQILEERGFRTAAFVSSFPLNRSFGLDRGFQVFDDETEMSPAGGELERSASSVTEKAATWLRGIGDEPFLAWVHYFDPHWPYDPPPPYGIARHPPASRYSPNDLRDANAIRFGFVPFGPTDREAFLAAYDGEIAFVDRCLGELIESIPEPRRDRLLILIAGDHGEAFGGHDYYFDHGRYLWSSAVRVPLIVYGPAVVPKPRVETALVRLLDVAPTLLEAAGVPIPAQFEGESLLPAAIGPIEWRVSIAEASKPWSVEVDGDYKNERKAKSIRVGNWKLILTPYRSQKELYNLQIDPNETENVIEAEPEIAARLESQLLAWIREKDPSFKGEDLTVQQDVRDKLKALGYY
jgi:arylsulfatase A-like enzyme